MVITADAGIITGGAEVVATTMVIATTGNLTVSSQRPLERRYRARRRACSGALTPIAARASATA